MIPLWPIELLELKRLTKTMNFATKTISVLMSRVWLIAVLMYGFTTVSCSGDDNGPKHDGKYIVTNPVEIIGMTYATLSGEYYPDNLPQAYANGMPMQFGVELSTSPRFEANNSLSGYVDDLQGSHFAATAFGLIPGTQYYARTFLEFGAQRLYGETQPFVTLPMELILSAEEVSGVSYDKANVDVKFSNTSALPSQYDNVMYGVLYSTEKDLLDNKQTMLNNDDFENGLLLFAQASAGVSSQKLVLDKLKSNTTYYYCASVLCGDQLACKLGPVKSFTTGNRDGLMTIDNIDAKLIYAELTGTTHLIETGLEYKLFYQGVGDSWVLNEEMKKDGNKLSVVLDAITYGRSYECWIGAVKNGYTVAESEKHVFKTDDPANHILPGEPTDITSTSATITCVMDAEGFDSEQWASVYYGKDKNNLINLTTAPRVGNQFVLTLKNLQPNTTYYYSFSGLCTLRFGYADWFKSPVKSFTTLPE
jgi:hypothetical protein